MPYTLALRHTPVLFTSIFTDHNKSIIYIKLREGCNEFCTNSSLLKNLPNTWKNIFYFIMLVIKILKKQLIFSNDSKEGNKSCATDQCFGWKPLARASWEKAISVVCRILSPSSAASGGLGDLIPFVGHQQYLQLNCILGFANPAPRKELINNWTAQADRENVLCTGGMDFSPCFLHGGCMTVNWAQECATENHTLTPTLLSYSLGPRIQLDHSALESCGGQAEGHRNLWGWLNPMCI